MYKDYKNPTFTGLYL